MSYHFKKNIHSSALLKTLVLFFLLIVASLLFALSFPNILFPKGVAILAYFALYPLCIACHILSLRWAWLWGFLYGFLSYALFNIWLVSFEPIAIFIVPPLAGVYLAIVISLFVYVRSVFSDSWAFLLQFLLWLLYEYVRTQGFLGYSFGLLAYSQAFYPALIQSASIFGIWSVSALVVFPSFLLAHITAAVYNKAHKARIIFKNRNSRILRFSMYIYIALFAGNLIYGFSYNSRGSDVPTNTFRVALLQHNAKPRENGLKSYQDSTKTLINLIRALMAKKEPPQLVVRPETAFVPSILYHLKYQQNPQYLALIREFLSVLAAYPDTDFIVGNAEILGENELKKEHDANKHDTSNKKNLHNISKEPNTYNAALLYRGDTYIDTYRKNHLVPFSESFPYVFPLKWFYNFLSARDVFFWRKGTEYKTLQGYKNYALSICFEDGFGAETALLVRKGADLIVNISNDAWSLVESNAMQHLQLSVMRAVENRRPVIRSATAGMTAVITDRGHIQSILPSFTQGALVGEIDLPIRNSKKDSLSFYSKYADLPIVVLLVSLSALSLFVLIKNCWTKRPKQI